MYELHLDALHDDAALTAALSKVLPTARWSRLERGGEFPLTLSISVDGGRDLPTEEVLARALQAALGGRVLLSDDSPNPFRWCLVDLHGVRPVFVDVEALDRDELVLATNVTAVADFEAGGVSPALCVARPLDGTGQLAARFAAELRALHASPAPEPPGQWVPLSRAECATLLAFRRFRTQAYDERVGEAAAHQAAARRLLDAFDVARGWTNSHVLEVVDAQSLELPRSYGFGTRFQLTGATFETTVLLEGSTHALLLVWTDED